MNFQIFHNEKTILHLSVENLCLKLETLRHPELKNVPFVLGTLSDRAAIQAVSQKASACGIYPGMPVSTAKKQCRSLVVIPPDVSFYQTWQTKIFHQLSRLSPLVEINTWGHYYVDLTGTQRLWGNPVDAAYRSQQSLKHSTELEAQAGLGTNKLVSRIASMLISPLEIYEVFPGGESRFMAPLDPAIIPGVGSVTQKRLQELNIHSLGKLSSIPVEMLKVALGPRAVHLKDFARGKGDNEVNTPSLVPRIRIRWPLPEEENDHEILLANIMALSEKLGYKLRKENRIPHLLKLEITYKDGVRARGQKTAAESFLHLDSFIFMTLKEIFLKIHKSRTRVKEISVSARKFSLPFRQLSLFSWDERVYQREEKLAGTLDTIRDRFGFETIRRGQTFKLHSICN